MTDKIFDDFIKDKLNEHSAPVPADMWERIVQKKEPDRPAALFGGKTLLSVFLLVATCALIGYLMWQSSEPAPENQNKSYGSSESLQPKLSQRAGGGSNTDLPEEVSKAEGEKNSSSHIKDFSHPGAEKASEIILKANPTPTNVSEENSKVLEARASTLSKQAVLEDSYSMASYNHSRQNMRFSIAMEERHLHNIPNNTQLFNQLKSLHISCLLDCPSARRPGRNDWYIEVFGSPDYAKKSIVRNNSIDANYFRRKDSTETMEGAFTAGVRITKSVGERMLIKTGLQYSQINEQFKYRTENERRLTTVVTIRTIIRAPGDTVRITDTSMIEQIGYREKITYNRYRSIDVPIILSYEWGNDSWRQSINAGVLLNLHSWQQGEMLDTSYMPVAFNKAGGQTFKTNIGVGAYVGFSILKTIGRSDVFAEPYFRYNISNMTTDNAVFNQKFNVAGVNLGIRYKLSGNRQRYMAR